MITESRNRKYLIRPVRESNIEVEYADYSFFELVKNRYRELNCVLMYK